MNDFIKKLEQAVCSIKPPEGMTFGCPSDWVYHDFPRTHYKTWNEFIDLLEEIGEENYKMLTFASYPRSKDEIRDEEGKLQPEQLVYRGQFMFSPKAIERFKEFVNDKKL